MLRYVSQGCREPAYSHDPFTATRVREIPDGASCSLTCNDHCISMCKDECEWNTPFCKHCLPAFFRVTVSDNQTTAVGSFQINCWQRISVANEAVDWPTDSWEGSVLPPARYLQPSPAAEVASTFRALRELPVTLASNETKAAVQQGQTTAVSRDWPTMMVPVGQGGQLSSNEEVCWGESQVVVCSVAYDRQRPIDLCQCHFHRSHKPFIMSSAPRCSFGYELPLDVFVGESSLSHHPVVVAEERLRETSCQTKPLLSDQVIIWQGTAVPFPKEADSIPLAIKREVPLELFSFQARQRLFFFGEDPNGFELTEFPQ
ncbi:hypothetical protein T02_3870 [Trichinella nativa]|uniref:Uncharacterized protein n=1 Tax=Trichinella nativa TaxID=6335 RepID=A0A0V1LDG8_9BILA|nr:hypothetical protein T02_3870 [Trichinella nativa]